MPPLVILLVDPRGWPTKLDPELVNSQFQARSQTAPDARAAELDARWYERLPRGGRGSRDGGDGSAVFLFLTAPLVSGWIERVRDWVNPKRRLYIAYTDNAELADVKQLTALAGTVPYRIAQQSAVGIDRAAGWIEEMLTSANDTAEPDAPPVKVTASRWRHLPSNRQDPHAYPDQYTAALEGAAGYKLTVASHRGKTHAHGGTFREDAVAIGVTSHWNLLAVADGAGTATYARVGSNLAVTNAVQAMRDAMPAEPSTDDLGRAIWAGLKAAHGALRAFAAAENLPLADLHTTLQLLIHWPQETSCLVGLAHVGDGIIAAETVDGQYYMLTEPDTDPEDSGRTLFLTSGPVRQWMERTKIYQFDERLNIVAMMTDGLSGDLEPLSERLPTGLFEVLRQRVLPYPLREREQALLAFLGYDRRGSFDDRTLAVLSRD